MKIKEITDRLMTLDNGKQVPIKEGAHIRSGYSQTGYISQGDQADHTLVYAPASIAGMINQRSWHTAISRARERMRIFTNSVELIEQRAPMPEDRGSALAIVKEIDKTKELDLQEGARRRWEKEPEQKIDIGAINAAFHQAAQHNQEREQSQGMER